MLPKETTSGNEQEDAGGSVGMTVEHREGFCIPPAQATVKKFYLRHGISTPMTGCGDRLMLQHCSLSLGFGAKKMNNRAGK